MPTNSAYYYGLYESNPKLWEQCLNDTKKEMLAAGWIVHARKFFTVQTRKAQILFRKLN